VTAGPISLNTTTRLGDVTQRHARHLCPQAERIDVGKVNADRIAMSFTGREGAEPEPPDGGSSPRPAVRRITMPSRDDAP